MNQHKSVKERKNYNKDIYVADVLNCIWNRKVFVLISMVVFLTIGILVSQFLPDKYLTNGILFPITENNSSNNSSLLNQFGGLANLAGVDIGGGSNSSQIVKALAILQSRSFLVNFIKDHQLDIPLIAGKPSSSGRIEIDRQIYDSSSERWVRDVSPPMQQVPTEWELYEEFVDIFSVERDLETNLVTLSLEWYDPFLIETWLTWLINDLNEVMRAQDLAEAERSLSYLQDQFEKTQLVQIRDVISNLIEQRIQTIMLAEVRDDYALEVIDPPFLAEEKSSPNRLLISIMAFFIGGWLSIIFLLIRYYTGPEKEEI